MLEYKSTDKLSQAKLYENAAELYSDSVSYKKSIDI